MDNVLKKDAWKDTLEVSDTTEDAQRTDVRFKKRIEKSKTVTN